jgi:hypothetical protein
MACDIWLRRDFLLRHGRQPDEPPCDHDPDQCPPAQPAEAGTRHQEQP